MCQSPVPVESMRMRSLRPASATALRNTPSAVGDRQMLPRQTNNTRATGCAMLDGVMGRPTRSSLDRKRHAKEGLLQLIQVIAQFGGPFEFQILRGLEHFLFEPPQFL